MLSQSCRCLDHLFGCIQEGFGVVYIQTGAKGFAIAYEYNGSDVRIIVDGFEY